MKPPLPALRTQLLQPLLTAILAAEAENASTVERRDYKRLPWTLIAPAAKLLPLAEAETLSAHLEGFDAWARGTGELWYFLERPRMGVKGHLARFWAYFDLQHAEACFLPPKAKPLDFRPEEIHPLPRPNLLEALTAQQTDIKALGLARQRMLRLARQLSLLPYYLGSQAADLTKEGLTALRFATAYEALELKQLELAGPEAESRLKGIYSVVKGFFLQTNEVELEYLSKLLDPEPPARLKGINFALTKLK